MFKVEIPSPATLGVMVAALEEFIENNTRHEPNKRMRGELNAAEQLLRVLKKHWDPEEDDSGDIPF